MYAYNVVVAAMCLIAVPVALAPVTAGTLVLPGRRSSHLEHVALDTQSVAPWIPAWTG